MKTRVLIIGAGPTGMGAAVRLGELGEDYLMVDAAEQVGGMAAAVTDSDGYTWDLGGHGLHSRSPYFDQAVHVSGIELTPVMRNGWVWQHGELARAPIQQHLTELPTDRHPSAPAANLAEYYRNHFGQQLYDRFFAPYTFKMWATPLEQIDHHWTSLCNSSWDYDAPAVSLASDAPARTEWFPYPVGGTGALWNAIYTKLLDPSRVLLGRRVADVNLARHIALLDSGQRIEYEHCVSTAPITTAMRWTGHYRLRKELVASQIYAVGLGFRGDPPPALADKTWLHSPDEQVPWYRATMLSNYDEGNAGQDRWNVLCEVSSSRHRPVSLDEAVQGTVFSMQGLGADLGRLETIWHRTIPMGYPVPTLGRDDILHRIDTTLLRHNMHSRGRFGGWRYESCDQDYAFTQGREAVDNALYGTPEDTYWHPECLASSVGHR